MLKRYTLKKLYITSLCLVVIFLFAIFPVKEDKSIFKSNLTILSNDDLESIYLKDDNDYLTLTHVYLESNELEQTLKDKINILIKDSILKNKVPKNFNSFIPKNTKVLDLFVKDGVVTVNFSKDILNVEKDDEEKMIEGIIYTLTEDNLVDKVIIQVDGKTLLKLPKSGNTLPSILTRQYGINKKYNIDSVTNITNTTIFYINDIDENLYLTPVTYVSNDTRDKVSIIIDELTSTPVYQSTLKSYLNSDVTLNNFEKIDNVMYLTFNEGVFNNNLSDSLLETVKYTISMSIMENYDINDVIITLE